MQHRTSILNEKESLTIKLILVILASTALIAEVLPEFEAKAIVIPTLLLTLFICSVEILKYISKHK
jgi:hypothetical protein